MYRLFFQLLSLAILSIVNLSIFTWCIEYYFGTNPQKLNTMQPIFNTVQAVSKNNFEETAHNNNVVNRSNPPPAIIVSSNKTLLSQNINSSSLERRNAKQLTLHFSENTTQLKPEHISLIENALETYQVSALHEIKIMAGAVANNQSDNTMVTNAKLRAQAIARVIYPRTQSVKMMYSNALRPNEVIIDFALNNAKTALNNTAQLETNN